MLTLKEIVKEGGLRNMPAHKIRGILREYIQIVILNSLYRQRQAKNIYFLGGTALRFLDNLSRFSEDLDFDACKLPFKVFKGLLDIIANELTHLGFQAEYTCREKDTLLLADIKLKGLLKNYQISSNPKEKLKVKLEINRPDYHLASETEVISGFGYLFPVSFMRRSGIFAEKILCLLNRNRGRDIYDIIFMLQKKYPVDMEILKHKKVVGDYGRIILQQVGKKTEKELRYLAAQVRPFLFNEEEAQRVQKVKFYLERLI